MALTPAGMLPASMLLVASRALIADEANTPQKVHNTSTLLACKQPSRAQALSRGTAPAKSQGTHRSLVSEVTVSGIVPEMWFIDINRDDNPVSADTPVGSDPMNALLVMSMEDNFVSNVSPSGSEPVSTLFARRIDLSQHGMTIDTSSAYHTSNAISLLLFVGHC